MPTFPPIPEYLIPLLAFIVPPIAGWLNDDGLPKLFNAILAGIVIAFLAFVCAVLTRSLSGDIIVNFMIVVAFAYALILGPLAPLHHWFVINVSSPFAALAGVKKPVARRASRDDLYQE